MTSGLFTFISTIIVKQHIGKHGMAVKGEHCLHFRPVVLGGGREGDTCTCLDLVPPVSAMHLYYCV